MAILRFWIFGFRLVKRQIPKHPPRNINGMVIGVRMMMKRTARTSSIFFKFGFSKNFFILKFPSDIYPRTSYHKKEAFTTFFVVIENINLILFFKRKKSDSDDSSESDSIDMGLFPQLFAVGNNLINCIWQELDGVAEWFVCGNICSDNHSWLKRSLAAARFEQLKPVMGTIFIIFQV